MKYVTTKAQRFALRNLYSRSNQNLTYRQFRKTAFFDFMGDCLMVPIFGIIVGIEKDGYTHS